MFVLALVHTFPFIVYHIQQGDMVEQWNTEVTYWTGVVALIAQGYLTFMSFPLIRYAYSCPFNVCIANRIEIGSTNSSNQRISSPRWYSYYSSFCIVTFDFPHGTSP